MFWCIFIVSCCCSYFNTVVVVGFLQVSVLMNEAFFFDLMLCHDVPSFPPGYLYSVLVDARCDLFCAGRLVWSPRPVSLLCRPVGIWCDAALSIIVRMIFSSLWQSVRSECLLWAASTSSLYLPQLAFFMLT